MADQPVRVLITCINGTMVPSAIVHLRGQSRFPMRIFGADMGEAGVVAGLLDGYHRIPSGESPDYVAKLLEVVGRERIQVVLPWSDAEAFALARNRLRLREAGAEAVVSSAECLGLIRDKFQTYRQLERAGIPVPPYACVSTMDDLRSAAAEYGYPQRTVIVKPSGGRGGRGLHVLCGRDAPPAWLGTGARERRIEAGADLAALPAMIEGETMVMPALGTPAYDVDVLARAGRPRAAVVRRRTNPTGIPFEGNRIVADPAAQRYCLDIAAALGLDSLHDIDLMTDPEGRLRLLEVNPRPSGSLAASLAAGAPLLDAAFAQALGRELPVPVPAADVTVLHIPMAVAAGVDPKQHARP